MNILTLLFVFSLLFSCKQTPEASEAAAQMVCAVVVDEEPERQEEAKSQMSLYMEEQGMVDVGALDTTLRIDLKYATTDNFTGTVLYDDLTRPYLHPIAAEKLLKAQNMLKEIHPGYSLLIYDAARPLSVQRKMYEAVKNTKYRAYVANPQRTGMHNYGMAVDLTICNEEGIPLDMGTPFDYFGKAAGINQEEQLRREGILSAEQINNRTLLRKVMTDAGFITIRGEWWHFNAVILSQAKKLTKVLE